MSAGRRVACALLAVLTLVTLAACSSGDNGKKITLGISATAPGGNILQLAVAQSQGYFREEGLDVEPVFLGSSGSVMQALATGRVQAGLSTPDLVLQANVRGQNAKMFYNWTNRNVSRFAVLPDSPIRSVTDLRGRTIGVENLASGPAQFAKASLAAAGIDPNRDVSFIAVGSGAPALDALNRRRVDAMIAYDTLFTAMTTGTGTTLRLFSPAGVEDLFASSFVASSEWLSSNPDAASGLGRAWAKATVFSEANPEAGVRMTFEAYPNSKVGATDAAATAAAMAQFRTRQESLAAGESADPPQWGAYPPQAVEHWISYARSSQQIDRDIDPATVYTNEFVPGFNDFDAAAIRAAATRVPS